MAGVAGWRGGAGVLEHLGESGRRALAREARAAADAARLEDDPALARPVVFALRGMTGELFLETSSRLAEEDGELSAVQGDSELGDMLLNHSWIFEEPADDCASASGPADTSLACPEGEQQSLASSRRWTAPPSPEASSNASSQLTPSRVPPTPDGLPFHRSGTPPAKPHKGSARERPSTGCTRESYASESASVSGSATSGLASGFISATTTSALDSHPASASAATLLKAQLAQLEALRQERMDAQVRERKLQRRVEALEAENARLKEDLEDERAQCLAAVHQVEQLGDARNGSEAVFEQIRSQLEDAKRALHLAEHAKAVAVKEAAIANDARLAAEQASFEREASQNEEMFVSRAEAKQLQDKVTRLQEELANAERCLQEESERSRAVQEGMERQIAHLQNELQLESGNLDKLRDLTAAVQEERQSARMTSDLLARAEDRLVSLSNDLDRARTARATAEAKLAEELERRRSAEHLLEMAKDRATSLEEQNEALAIGNGTLHRQHAEFERARVEVADLRDRLAQVEERVAAAKQETAASEAARSSLEEQLDKWKQAVQVLHNVIASSCVQARAESQSPVSSATATVELSAEARRKRGLPEELETVLDTLTSLGRIYANIARRGTEAANDMQTQRDRAQRREEEVRVLRSKIEAVAQERDQAYMTATRSRDRVHELTIELKQVSQECKALERELQIERELHQNLNQAVRRKLLRTQMDVGDETVSMDESVEYGLEELTEHVCQLISTSRSLAGFPHGSSEHNEEQLLGGTVSPPSTGERPGSSRQGSAMAQSGWVQACLLLARAQVGYARLVGTLVSHKRILWALVARASRIEAASRTAANKTNMALQRAAPGLIDGLALPPRRRLRQAALAVVAARRFQAAGRSGDTSRRPRFVVGPCAPGYSVVLANIVDEGPQDGQAPTNGITESSLAPQGSDRNECGLQLQGLFSNQDMTDAERLSVLLRTLSRTHGGPADQALSSGQGSATDAAARGWITGSGQDRPPWYETALATLVEHAMAVATAVEARSPQRPLALGAPAAPSRSNTSAHLSAGPGSAATSFEAATSFARMDSEQTTPAYVSGPRRGESGFAETPLAHHGAMTRTPVGRSPPTDAALWDVLRGSESRRSAAGSRFSYDSPDWSPQAFSPANVTPYASAHERRSDSSAAPRWLLHDGDEDGGVLRTPTLASASRRHGSGRSGSKQRSNSTGSKRSSVLSSVKTIRSSATRRKLQSEMEHEERELMRAMTHLTSYLDESHN